MEVIILSENQSVKNRIKKIIETESETERAHKSSMQGKIDRADGLFQFCLLLFGLGFWVIMILKMFL